MGVDDVTSIDTLSLLDFQRTLQARLDEATTVLVWLTMEQQKLTPALGDFLDATEVAGRHQRLRDEYSGQIQRLVGAVAAAQMAARMIAERYDTGEELNTARVRDIADTLRPVGEVLDGGR